MTLLVRVIMPLTEMSLLMSEGFKSRMTLVSTRLCGFVCSKIYFLHMQGVLTLCFRLYKYRRLSASLYCSWPTCSPL